MARSGRSELIALLRQAGPDAAVDVGDADVYVEIQNPDAKATVASFLATQDVSKTGVYNTTIDRATMDNLTKRFYKLTVKTRNSLTAAEAPVYINDNYGVPLDLEVLEAYYSTTSIPTESDGGSFDVGTL